MKRLIALIIIIFFSSTSIVFSAENQGKNQSGKASKTKDTSSNTILSKEFGMNYKLGLPGEYEQSPEKKWPLVVYLHGAGQRGTDPSMLVLPKTPLLKVDGATS